MTIPVRVHLLTLVISLAACGSAAPQVNALGVTGGKPRSLDAGQQTVLVFLEVINPTKLDLSFSRLQYQFNAESWFSVAGEVALSRSVQAGSSAVIEVPVSLSDLHPARVDQGMMRSENQVTYSLEGRIFARADRMERSWNVTVRGVLSPEATRVARQAIDAPMHVADTQP